MTVAFGTARCLGVILPQRPVLRLEAPATTVISWSIRKTVPGRSCS
ncbi:MAG: hypothetical protein JJ992_18450 [Planctomycetes bacterium]|nr:hypothetical protein [Planctomycetota bacterium]